MRKRFPFFLQMDSFDCGPTCLKMIASNYGKDFSLRYLRERASINKLGTSFLGIKDAAKSIGLDAVGVKIDVNQLSSEDVLPCILHWNENHFVVCYNIKKNIFGKIDFFIADPANGLIKFSKDELEKNWLGVDKDKNKKGVALIFNTTPAFFENNSGENIQKSKIKPLFKYFEPFRNSLFLLLTGIFLSSFIQLLFPFLTQSIVDIGIKQENLDFVKIVLIAQLVLFIARMSVEFIRSWILLHVNTRVNISLISDFLHKVMKMPLNFFDTKTIGDILQRINDHKRIESFLTSNSVFFLFSITNFLVFATVLGFYNLKILVLFLVGNSIYVTYVLLFMKYRRSLDYKKFAQSAQEQSNIIQLISGMKDIKLGNYENKSRWKWEQIQVSLFKLNIKSLTLQQLQQVGSIFFSQLTNILITFLSAKLVIDGNITLGMMMAITYIIGQLSSPIDQFISFSQSFQDTKISLERLNEIHSVDDEDDIKDFKTRILPGIKNITIKDLSFSYDNSDSRFVLKNLNFMIPQKKVTAIVGASGSGKTTLIKLLLGFYSPTKGEICIGDVKINNFDPHFWRSNTGSVLQDGYIFSESIANNITLGDSEIDYNRLLESIRISNLMDFIDKLPLGLNTKIGADGLDMSQGQKQRVLIARAVYKNPEFMFFDEATNSLDAKNEKIIVDNLYDFYKNKTIVIVAHRLSTVKNADNIIVFDEGKVVESGTHSELTSLKGYYYSLVKNQLELGE